MSYNKLLCKCCSCTIPALVLKGFASAAGACACAWVCTSGPLQPASSSFVMAACMQIEGRCTSLLCAPALAVCCSRPDPSVVQGAHATRGARFAFIWSQARAPAPAVWCSRPGPSVVAEAARRAAAAQAEFSARSGALRTAIVRQQLFFPDRRLIQYDCGKLQVPAA